MGQSVSRKTRGGANREKAVARLDACHGRIAAMRRDFLHQRTSELVRDHALIAIEDLAVKSMTASAAGTVRTPGRNVRAKAGLNRTILRNGWSMARSLLEYQAAWSGVMLVAAPPAHTSQACSACGHTAAENRRTQAVFQCLACGHTGNADRNAAKSILRRGEEIVSGDARRVPRDTRERMPVRARFRHAGGRAQRLGEGQSDFRWQEPSRDWASPGISIHGTKRLCGENARATPHAPEHLPWLDTSRPPH